MTRRCMVFSQHRETQLQIESGCFFLIICIYFDILTSLPVTELKKAVSKVIKILIYLFLLLFLKRKRNVSEI